MGYSINDLPVELLIEIMGHLDGKSLGEANLTCEKWNQVIEERCSWPIILRSNDRSIHSTVRRLLQTKRKFHVQLSVVNRLETSTFDIIKLLGCRVVQLFYSLLDSDLFLQLLKCFPKLQYIHLKSVNFAKVSEADDLPDLKQLKMFKAYECDDNIFKCFRTSGLRSVDIRVHLSLSTSSVQHAGNFIRCQNNLRKLTLLPNFEDSLFRRLCHATPNGTVPCTLILLTLNLDWCSNDSVGFLNFLKIHSKAIRKLDIGGKCSNAIFEVVFGELLSLKSLTLRNLPVKTEFGETLKENRSIEDLTLACNNLSPLALSQLVKCVPNVTKLILNEEFTNEQLQIIATALNKVTTLWIKLVRGGNLNEIKFPNLTSLKIQHLAYDAIDWDAFSKSNSQITELVIWRRDDGALNLDDIDAMTRSMKLQTLNIGYKLVADERFCLFE